MSTPNSNEENVSAFGITMTLVNHSDEEDFNMIHTTIKNPTNILYNLEPTI